jgi:hypothetical protein
MSSTDAFATIRRARSLRERHPDAPLSAVLVALVMATYANGATGTSIRPGTDRLVDETGLDRRTIQRAIAWLVERGELRRDKPGHRGSAACFTFLKGDTSDTLSSEKGDTGVPKGCRSDRPTNQTSQRPTEPSVPPVSEELESGEPFTCSAGHVNGQFWDRCDECREFRLMST